MALKMDVVTADDNEISQAYFKIVTTVVEWIPKYVVVVLGCWKGKNAYQNGKRQLTLEQDLSFRMEFTEEPVTRQGIYDWLKTQEYFTTAVDATE